MRDAGSLGEQLPAPVSTVRIGHHHIPRRRVEQASVRHRRDGYLLPAGTCHVHRVTQSGRGVKIIGQILEPQAPATVQHIVQQHHVVVRALHLVDPKPVAHLQNAFDFAPREAQGVEHVVITVKVEHVAHMHIALFDSGRERHRGRERELRPCGRQLYLMHEVHEGRRPEISVLALYRMREAPNLPGHVILRVVDVAPEVMLHVFRRFPLIIRQVGGFPLHGDDLVAVASDFNVNVNLAHDHGHARRRAADDRLPRRPRHCLAVAHVVVPVADHVEAFHLAGHVQRCIFGVCRRDDAAFLSGMEKSDQHVRLLPFPDDGNPLPGTSHQVLELQPAPQRGRQPVRHGRSRHAQDCHFDTLPFQYGIRRQVALARRLVDDVRPQDGKTAIGHPVVIHPVPRLQVVVPHRPGVVCHIVHHLRCQVLPRGHHEVTAIHHGVSLQDVPPVEQQQAPPVSPPQALHVGIHPRQASPDGMVVHVVAHEKASMHVARVYNLQAHHPSVRSLSRHKSFHK